MRRIKRKPRLTIEALESRQLLTVVINELHYDPPDKTQRAEFVEIYNNSDDAQDLSGWAFDQGIDYAFPDGARIEPRGYLVVGEDPATLNGLFGVVALGPWNGTLRNSGEAVRLVDDAGNMIDEVDYGRGFPWPTVGDEPGYSIELIHPDLPNDVGGHWRRARGETAKPVLLAAGSTWQYFPGVTSPEPNWNERDFDDASWRSGAAPLGYGDPHVATQLDMRGDYSTLYLRTTIELDDPASVGDVQLSAQFDDGFRFWVNGHFIASQNVPSGDLSNTATANSALENLEFVDIGAIPNSVWVTGTNVIAVQLLNASRNGSSDAWFDATLVPGSTGNVSPGRPNTVLSTHEPPAVRKVSHGDGTIATGDLVTVTAKVTDDDGVGDVTLEYQVVEPGDYFGRYLKAGFDGTPALNPRYDDPVEWISISMSDDGTGGDQQAQDDVYSAIIPGDVNRHRHLIRYRIRVADTLGDVAQVPYSDDPQHNFAYFVYDGVPDWTGSVQPGVEPTVTYDFDELGSIATYHLLTASDDLVDAQHLPGSTTSGYTGSEYLWPGTLVYDGHVYDNIRYRARGGVWRYAMGKNMWKFDFNRGHGFQAKDDYGEEYSESWDKLNFSAIIQQGDYRHRGEQGLFESVGFKLFNLAGVAAPETHYVHFRIIDSEQETGSDQYTGDFRGLYLAVEQPDGHFLDEHDLPDGNLYKVEGHQGTSNNQGPTQVSDASDVAAFIAGYRNRQPSADWWEANLDLPGYYSYRTIVEGIHHYDIAYGKNYFYYHNPETDKFQILPWDIDLTWANNMYGSGQHDFATKVAENPAFVADYHNRVRELRDLLFNAEQTGLLIDEFAAMIYSSGEVSWVDADRAMWDYNPILASSAVNSSKAGQGRFYERSATDDFAGMIQLMKNYVATRSRFLDRITAESDAKIPVTPTITYVGDERLVANRLAFAASEYADPEGSAFQAMEWRLAEVTDSIRSGQTPKYEINAVVESGQLDEFVGRWEPTSRAIAAGARYRARVRVQNATGHWSHWSDPVEFVAAAADLASSLRVSEVHYHPAEPSGAELAAGFDDADEFEFLEFVNVGAETIDLSAVSLQRVDVDGVEQGVDFDFSTAAISQLAPGERLVLVENIDAFEFRYGPGFPIAGQWSGKLNNSGEKLTVFSNSEVVQEFVFADTWHNTTDGDGFSLEVVDPSGADLSLWSVARGWLPSVNSGGTPAASRVIGDISGDLTVNAADVDRLFELIAADQRAPQFDLTGDKVLNADDADHLVDKVLNTFTGDADLDGTVDFGDFLVLSANFGKQNQGWANGDFDGDKLISFADFLLLSANFGESRAVS